MDSTLRGKRERGEYRQAVIFRERPLSAPQIVTPHLNFTIQQDWSDQFLLTCREPQAQRFAESYSSHNKKGERLRPGGLSLLLQASFLFLSPP